MIANILSGLVSLLLILLVEDAQALVSSDERTSHQADFRCGFAVGLFAAVSFACFLPAIGISISF